MKKYSIDLDLPPEKRWLPLLMDYRSSSPLIIDYYNNQVHSKLLGELIDKLLGNFDQYFGELGLEMKAVANYMDIDLGIIIGLNMVYELRRVGGGPPNTTGNGVLPPFDQRESFHSGYACTSIVAQDLNGTVYHGRNLDWNLPDNLRNLTVQGDFIKDGEVLFTADVTIGFVGLLTGTSKHGFSISINERNLGGYPFVDGLDAFVRHGWEPTHLLREVLTSATSYDSAVESLKNEPLVAPVYYITAGNLPNQGTVITRDRNSVRDIWSLSASDPESWYLLETNYDHWLQPVSYDNRRYYGNEYMKKAGRERAASVSGLFAVLSTWPIRNNYTTYTSIMNPKAFTMMSYDVYIV